MNGVWLPSVLLAPRAPQHKYEWQFLRIKGFRHYFQNPAVASKMTILEDLIKTLCLFPGIIQLLDFFQNMEILW